MNCPRCKNDLTAPLAILYHVPAQQSAHIEIGKGVVFDEEAMAFPKGRFQPVCIKCGTSVETLVQAAEAANWVRPSQGCPECGERDPDNLALGEGEFEGIVQCRICKKLYEIG